MIPNSNLNWFVTVCEMTAKEQTLQILTPPLGYGAKSLLNDLKIYKSCCCFMLVCRITGFQISMQITGRNNQKSNESSRISWEFEIRSGHDDSWPLRDSRQLYTEQDLHRFCLTKSEQYISVSSNYSPQLVLLVPCDPFEVISFAVSVLLPRQLVSCTCFSRPSMGTQDL